MEVVLYTDLNCPFCYATETRLEALGAQERVEWRGVEHEPDLPVPMARDDADLNEEIADEVSQVRVRAPEVAIELPPGKPNTALAIATAAAVARADPERARVFRHAIYRAFWVDGADLSQTEVLESIAREHGVGASRSQAQAEDDLRVTNWRLDWERSPLRGVPLLVRADGEVLYGLKDIEALRRFMELA